VGVQGVHYMIVRNLLVGAGPEVAAPISKGLQTDCPNVWEEPAANTKSAGENA